MLNFKNLFCLISRAYRNIPYIMKFTRKNFQIFAEFFTGEEIKTQI